MKEELSCDIVEKYPEMFVNVTTSPRKRYLDISCGDGWYTIINQLCKLIQLHCINNNIDCVVITKIKEKYGTLQINYVGGDSFISGLVAITQIYSTNICEECGTNQYVKIRNNNGWMKTLCEKCSNEV